MLELVYISNSHCV